MQPIVYKIRLDAGKPGSQASICVKQGDIKSRQLSIYLYNNSVPFKIPNGATVVLQAIKPDETVIFNDCDISGNIITHTITEQMLTVAGTVSCELVVYGTNGEVLFSPGFDVYVEAGNSNRIEDPATSSSEFTGLTEAMRKATDLTAKWSNPEVEVTVGETPSGKVEFGEDSVNFTLTVPNIGGGGGTPGGPGAVFTPHVSEDGTISWTNNGGLPNPEPQNIKGEPGSDFKIKGYYSSIDELNIGVPAPEPGDAYGIGEGYPYDIYVFDGVSFDWVNNGSIQGPPGEDGKAATIQIGTVTTGEPGSEAQATNSGTENEAVIDFVIPRGNPGPGVPAGGTTGQYLRKASDEDYSAEWADAVAGSNPNLLDNWYFLNPINQRGETQYTGLIPIIDRWKGGNGSSVISVEQGGLRLREKDGSTGNPYMTQIVENWENILLGKQVTFSALVEDEEGGNVGVVVIQDGTTTIFSSGTEPLGQGLTLLTVTAVLPASVSNPLKFALFTTKDNSNVIYKAAKLEFGDKQTLAHQDGNGNWVLNDPPPDYGTELLKCQRYFYRLKSRTSSFLFLGTVLAQSATTCFLMYSLPVEMRIQPTFQHGDISNICLTQVDPKIADQRETLTAIAAVVPNNRNARIQLSGAFTEKQVYNAWLITNGYIDFSADL